MQKDSVAEVLRSLASGDKDRSETARLRDVFPDVEAALQAGVSRAAILNALHAQGFTMTLRSFESALYRIRRQRGKAAPTPNPSPAENQPSAQTSDQGVAAEAADLPQPGAGKTLTEQVMNTAPQKFSFKQQQKAKDQK